MFKSLDLSGSIGRYDTDKIRTPVFAFQRIPTEIDEMSDPALSDKQRQVIIHLLSSRSVEEGCRRARINKTTVYEWLKNENFRGELKRQRDLLIETAFSCLKASVVKATKTLNKHLYSKCENISIRAAERIIEFTQKALEQEELERRVQALEERVAQQGTHR
jgi:hypothetical protein